ncbi:hypothetical protein [Candidatus Tisiphia endosymbiont of Nemotelus uliginosus]|uniref:hypothetical protein n=1 Tax=Candidatus Tisiphia endosymbiont of Nemotelus uliginosus TaxID=3077926 RepID=UPI0035C8D30A
MKDAYYWDDIVDVFQGSRSLCFVARESGEMSWKSVNLMRTTSHNSTLAANVATIIYKYFTDNNLEDINLKLIDSNSMSAIKCLPKVNQIILEKELSKAAKDSQRADKIIKQVIGYHEAKKAEEDFKINFLLAKDVGKTILPELSHAAVTSYPIGIKDSEFLENESNNPENPGVIWLENDQSDPCPLSWLNRDCSLHISKYLSELPTTEEDFETVLSFTEASYSYDDRGLWEGDVQPALVVTEDSYDLEDWSFDSDSDCAPPLNAQPSHVQSVLVSGDSSSYSDLDLSDFE